MFRAIGIILILLYVTSAFSDATTAFENALVATFNTIETAAHISASELESATR